jgi:hypothetical protein
LLSPTPRAHALTFALAAAVATAAGALLLSLAPLPLPLFLPMLQPLPPLSPMPVHSPLPSPQPLQQLSPQLSLSATHLPLPLLPPTPPPLPQLPLSARARALTSALTFKVVSTADAAFAVPLPPLNADVDAAVAASLFIAVIHCRPRHLELIVVFTTLLIALALPTPPCCLLLLPLNTTAQEPPSITVRRPCPIDVCIDVNLLLFELNSPIVNCKSMPTKELSPGLGLDCKAQSCIQRKAGNNKEHLVVVWLQTEAMGKVKAIAIACIERKPDGLGVGDES